MKRSFAILLGLACVAWAVSAPAAPAFRPGTTPAFLAKDDKVPPLVDLNSAAKPDLVRLPGLGEAAADKIIAGRPWRSKYDLVLKKVVTRGNYDKFSRFVVARQPDTAAK